MLLETSMFTMPFLPIILRFSIRLCTVVLLVNNNTNMAFADPPGVISNSDGENPFSYVLTSYLGESGWVVKRPTDYEYAPSVIKVRGNNSTVHMWFCGGGGSGTSGGDSIWYTHSDSYGQWGTWTTPVEVIRPSNRNDYLDYAHACDPSVTRYGNYYYLMYTGAPDWRSSYGETYCLEGGPIGCDNRVFIARVPAAKLSKPSAYQKLVNVGECPQKSCYRWKYFWADFYPPVPIVHNEIGSVWRRIGTRETGYTTPQTRYYGIGQPSQVSIWALRIWFTRKLMSSGGEVHVWWRTDSDIANPYQVQDYSTYSKTISNSGNDVNYDIAFDGARNHYVATAVRELSTNPPSRPCVHMAHVAGFGLPVSSNHIISNNLLDQPGCFLEYAENDAHNAGFLRDQWGYLTTMEGHPGGTSYYWVYYGAKRSALNTANAGAADINRLPFTLSP